MGTSGSLGGTPELGSGELETNQYHHAMVDYDDHCARHVEASNAKPYPSHHLGGVESGTSEPSIDVSPPQLRSWENQI
jgi:hypothetical protein